MIAGHIQNRELRELVFYCKCGHHTELHTDLQIKELDKQKLYCSQCNKLINLKGVEK